MRAKRCSLTLVALLFGAPAIAQEQTGAIEGVVRDTQGAVVPGVVVLARNASGLSIELTTDESGTYRFPSLPPGRYELLARLSGFAPARVVDIELKLGVELRIDLTLRPAGVTERVEVVSASPVVAITQSARATSLRDEEIEKMPRGRDFTSLATQVAGTNNESKLGGIAIDGSSSSENRYIIDGVETGDTWVGTSAENLVTDFVEELQVKSSGYSAEYGGSTGGVLNAITKSGSNGWHGEALLYWSGDALDAGPRPTLRLKPTDESVAEYVTYPEDRYHQLEAGFTLSGPIVRDRVWFFAGYIPSFRPLDRTVTFLADGTTGTYHQQARLDQAAASLTAQLGPRWRARAAFSMGTYREDAQLPPQDGSGNPAAEYSIRGVYPNYSASASLDFTPGSRALLSLRAGYFFNDWYNEGVYRGDQYVYQTSAVGFPGVPPQYQQPLGYANVPSNWSSDKQTGPRLTIALDGTVFFSAAGRHQLKGGIQLDQPGLDTLQGQTGNEIDLYWGQDFDGQSGAFGYYQISSNPVFPNRGPITQGEARVNNLGLFVQDSWRLGKRLTLNLGLRTENEHVPSFANDPRIPMTAIHFGFGEKLAPRLGFAWDATGDGKTKLYGSWGVFYDITKLLMPLIYFGGNKGQIYWYTLDSGDIGTIVDNPECPPTCPGSLILGPLVFPSQPANDPENNQIDPDLKPMRTQEAVLGVEREVRPGLSVSARYIHKQLDMAVEDIHTLDAQMNLLSAIGNPGFGRAATIYPQGGTSPVPFPKAKRDYDAVELALDKRLSSHWSARASYTWSRLYGNYSGLVGSDYFDGNVAPNVTAAFDYPLMSFDERGEPVYGVLATDRTHQLKAQLLLDFPFGTSVGASWFGASGIPRTRAAAFVPPWQWSVFYRGRHSDGRLPFLSQLDLYVQHQVRLGPKVRLAVSANVINALNQGTVTNYSPDELYLGQAIAVDETELYARGVDTQALIAEQGLVRDARFLKASGFQAPRTIRLGVKLGF